jgi:hypothetical protein
MLIALITHICSTCERLQDADCATGIILMFSKSFTNLFSGSFHNIRRRLLRDLEIEI